ncbi:uncharacterized protein H6S33_009831 [Morchella sextelata]|uniref:uncharacterized protein n=1 Tax=Morchella sextelata TaxID=1174677 RepID=UPI001D04570D|nr:uncharacterized protein H6S33_009831 [Morchella sextelata]KAH0602287.1 hypothetical protein H6S33_009831 [Morchella sextelata]
MEKWVKVKVLGEGSYGVVWLEKGEQGAVRAVKQISRANTTLNQRERHALTELKGYPDSFVELFESGCYEDQNNIYLAMEYIEHGDLMGVVKNRQGSISENEIKSITRQLLTALKIMHSKNFCHRDLKPQNILVASISPIKVKVADFGVTKQASDSTQLRTVVGTWGYMAPEVLGFSDAETSGYTSSADIWSLGSLLHFMFTNEVPFPDNRKLINYARGNNAQFPTEKLQNSQHNEDDPPDVGNIHIARVAFSALERWLRIVCRGFVFWITRSRGRIALPIAHIPNDIQMESREIFKNYAMVKKTTRGDFMRQENCNYNHRKTFCSKGNGSESREKTKELDKEAKGLVLLYNDDCLSFFQANIKG